MHIFEPFKGKKILLLTHHNADVDALASALLLKRILKQGDIGVAGGISLSARHLIPNDTDILVNPDPSGYDLTILLDTSTADQLTGIDIRKAKQLIVIDHHSPHESLGSLSFKSFIYPECISCTELICQVFNPSLDHDSARLVLLGIISDSARLRFASTKTFSFVASLLQKHNLSYSQLCNSLDIPLQLSERIACIKGAQRAQLHRIGKYLILACTISSFEASVAKSLVALGADAAFVACDAGPARISARARTTFIKEFDLHLGKDIMGKAGAVLGGSGSGHNAAAGANGPLLENLDKALDMCISVLKEKISKKGV